VPGELLYSQRLAPRRLDRAISDLGACSRREAVRWVLQGRVSVDGRVETEPGRRVDPGHQTLRVDGLRLAPDPERLVYAFHKPTGVLTTRQDPGGRRTVYDCLDPDLPWLFPVGRLDRDSSGLLILTNDHRLAHALTDPASGIQKTYHVRVAGLLDDAALGPLRAGLTLDDGTQTRPAAVRLLGATRAGETWLEVALREGRYRQVRRMCGTIGHPVRQLVRVAIGGLFLGDLPLGALRRLEAADVRRLRLPAPPEPAQADRRRSAQERVGDRRVAQLDPAHP